MLRHHHATGAVLAVLLASCAGNSPERTASTTGKVAADSAAPAPTARPEADQPVPPPQPAPPPPPYVAAPVAQEARGFGTRGFAIAQRRAGAVRGLAGSAVPRMLPRPYVGRDRFPENATNAFKVAQEEPVSTFSIDVDTASYAFVRASLNGNVLPPADAVRTEEMINYFSYDYLPPRSAAEPFSTSVAVFPSPWSPGRKLVRLGIKGYAIQRQNRPRANLVFLVDTSGSMAGANRLPLVKQSLAMLLQQLGATDTVAIVAYAGRAGTVLEPTPAAQKGRVLAAIDRLEAGGSTAGAEGIRQAYALAERNLDPSGVNRVILATDGDFNVGITEPRELKGFVERERARGVFLSVLGFGMGNYNDALMQALAQNGNGTAAYIDTISEARKTLVEEATSTLFPIAKDVKIQVEFNPASVAEYRLIGYETRLLNRDDFDNDKVDAGDVGSGQSVTALYEIVPVGGPRTIGDLRYTRSVDGNARRGGHGSEYGFVKIRYKLPNSDRSMLIATPIDRKGEVGQFAQAPRDARFAAGVAGFAELLRGGRHVGQWNYDDVLAILQAARGEDEFGYRAELVQLVRTARTASSMARLER